MPFCRVGDLQAHYRIVGEGPPLVPIMGLAGGRALEEIARLLKEHLLQD